MWIQRSFPSLNKTATRLILDKGALNAVTMALAHLSGSANSLDKRSLIDGNKNYTTFKLSSRSSIYNNMYVHDLLKRIIPREENIRYENIRVTNNKKNGYFDIPTEKVSLFMELYKEDHELEHNRYYSIQEADVKERNRIRSISVRRGGFGNRGRGFRGRGFRGRGFRGRSNYGDRNRGGRNDYGNRNRGGYNRDNRNFGDDRSDKHYGGDRNFGGDRNYGSNRGGRHGFRNDRRENESVRFGERSGYRHDY